MLSWIGCLFWVLEDALVNLIKKRSDDHSLITPYLITHPRRGEAIGAGVTGTGFEHYCAAVRA